MSGKFPITRDRIRHHFHYDWWQYAILAAVAIFGWNLLYTMTHYRSPEHLKVEWYFQGPASDRTVALAEGLMEEVKAEQFPDMEEVAFNIVGMDQTYGDMQIMVWMAAGQGDLYMLKEDSFKGYAAGDSFIDLQPYVDSGMLNVEGLNLKKGYVKSEETGEKKLFGIPADALTGLKEYDILPEGTVLAVTINGGNIENTLKLLQHLLTLR